MKINKEWVAATGASLNSSFTSKKAAIRYGNFDYTATDTGVYHRGDAMGIAVWNGGNNSWLKQGVDSDVSGFVRAYSGSIFSYYGNGAYTSNSYSDGTIMRAPHPTRAVIVMGTGL